MPTPIFMNAFTAAVAAIGVAAASFVGMDHEPAAYDDVIVTRLSQDEAALNATFAFMRADRDGDETLSVDEYAALMVVTAELANLNGFVAVETRNSVATIALPVSAPGALGDEEQTRIDAVARHTFYAFAGNDGKMQQGEYLELQNSIFAASDLNANGSLTNAELSIFAQRQANLRPNA